MAVYLVKQLSSTVLLQRLRAKGIRNPDHSRALSTYDNLILFMQLNYFGKVENSIFSTQEILGVFGGGFCLSFARVCHSG